MSAPKRVEAGPARPQAEKPRPEWGNFLQERQGAKPLVVSGTNGERFRSVVVSPEGLALSEIPNGARIFLLSASSPELIGENPISISVETLGQLPRYSTNEYQLAAQVRTIAEIAIPESQNGSDSSAEVKPTIVTRQLARVHSLQIGHLAHMPSQDFFVNASETTAFSGERVYPGMKIPGTEKEALQIVIVSPQQLKKEDAVRASTYDVSPIGMEVLTGEISSVIDYFEQLREDYNGKVVHSLIIPDKALVLAGSEPRAVVDNNYEPDEFVLPLPQPSSDRRAA